MVKIDILANLLKIAKKKYKYNNNKNKKCNYDGCSKKIYENKNEMKKLKKINFCKFHRCYIRNCTNITNNENKYCYYHKCNNQYCQNYVLFSGICDYCSNIVNNNYNYHYNYQNYTYPVGYSNKSQYNIPRTNNYHQNTY